jgi:hypothetical protein
VIRDLPFKDSNALFATPSTEKSVLRRCPMVIVTMTAFPVARRDYRRHRPGLHRWRRDSEALGGASRSSNATYSAALA